VVSGGWSGYGGTRVEDGATNTLHLSLQREGKWLLGVLGGAGGSSLTLWWEWITRPRSYRSLPTRVSDEVTAVLKVFVPIPRLELSSGVDSFIQRIQVLIELDWFLSNWFKNAQHNLQFSTLTPTIIRIITLQAQSRWHKAGYMAAFEKDSRRSKITILSFTFCRPKNHIIFFHCICILETPGLPHHSHPNLFSDILWEY